MIHVNEMGEMFMEGTVCGKYFSAILDDAFYFRVMDDENIIAYDLIMPQAKKDEELFGLLVEHGKAGFKSHLTK